jgi:hypothetical protein
MTLDLLLAEGVLLSTASQFAHDLQGNERGTENTTLTRQRS